MVNTGYIQFVELTGGGQDNNGNPIPPVSTITNSIECNLQVITKEYKILVDQQYQQIKYQCIVDRAKVDALAINLESIKSVVIRDAESNVLGTYQIHNLEYLNLVQQIKIAV